MQFNYTTSILKERKFVIAWTILKTVILIYCLVVIYQWVYQDQVKLHDLVVTVSELPFHGWVGIVLITMLAALNWLPDAIKWKFLTRHIEKISIRYAYRSVVICLSFGFATPRALGDYIGRTLIFQDDNKLKIILPVSAILFFGAFNYPVLPVLSASLLIWVINILIPALSGIVLAGKTKM